MLSTTDCLTIKSPKLDPKCIKYKENKLIVTKCVQNLHLVGKGVCVWLTFPDFKPVLPQQKSQLCVVCRFP